MKKHTNYYIWRGSFQTEFGLLDLSAALYPSDARKINRRLHYPELIAAALLMNRVQATAAKTPLTKWKD